VVSPRAAYEGLCAFAVSMGERVASDLTSMTRHDGVVRFSSGGQGDVRCRSGDLPCRACNGPRDPASGVRAPCTRSAVHGGDRRAQGPARGGCLELAGSRSHSNSLA